MFFQVWLFVKAARFRRRSAALNTDWYGAAQLFGNRNAICNRMFQGDPPAGYTALP